MHRLTKEFIKRQVADSPIIFKRGEYMLQLGNFSVKHADMEKKSFHYVVDGNYGEYDVKVWMDKDNRHLRYSCSCPYHSDGCKHTVAVCLDIIDRVARAEGPKGNEMQVDTQVDRDEPLGYDELRAQALESRQKSAEIEKFHLTPGETFKGEHLVQTERGREYTVTLHDPVAEKGHCTCPDFNCNRLGTCKHIIHVARSLAKKRGFASRSSRETFPFVHVYWDSAAKKPRFYYDRPLPAGMRGVFSEYFDPQGFYLGGSLGDFYGLIRAAESFRNVRIDEHLLRKVGDVLFQAEVNRLRDSYEPDFSRIRADLYPYQREGVMFSLFKRSAIIADEMGLGKTLQAITLAVLKKDLFDFNKVLVVTPASLKEQWRREIERFCGERVIIVQGTKAERQAIYSHKTDYFKITNYEALLRDRLAIARFNPDLIILDEAQRIKNFEAKTSEAVKAIPHRHSIVLSGTPLENRLEDLYSVVQFADHELLTPLWEFAAEHFILKRDKRNRVFGYRNLDTLHEKLKSLVIRRRKEQVLKDLPEQVTNTYYIDLTREQLEIHQGYLQLLVPILSKKFLTPIDIKRIQELLMCMRMVCDSTYLIDRKTNLSPKLAELQPILADLVLENGRKTVIFSEWTTMTFLIGKVLSDMGIPFVEFTGKVPVIKRQALINEFNNNPECKVFLATDAGGVGLNLQSADCVINFELPWNPAKINQRVGRVLRIGQKSKCVNVVNLVAKSSIEEKVLAGLNLKQELFDGVFDGTTDAVEFTQERKAAFVNRIRAMLGDEPIAPLKESPAPEEIPESTPHFLNPKALEERPIDISAEEDLAQEEAQPEVERISRFESQARALSADEHEGVRTEAPQRAEAGEPTSHRSAQPGEPRDTRGPESAPDRQGEAGRPESAPEQMEEVLENGMRFLSGLMAMATGKPLVTETENRMITIDRQTGEVTLKFKLPTF
jgi:superfamily II DNA or RNA helicase